MSNFEIKGPLDVQWSGDCAAEGIALNVVQIYKKQGQGFEEVMGAFIEKGHDEKAIVVVTNEFGFYEISDMRGQHSPHNIQYTIPPSYTQFIAGFLTVGEHIQARRNDKTDGSHFGVCMRGLVENDPTVPAGVVDHDKWLELRRFDYGKLARLSIAAGEFSLDYAD